MPSVGFTISIFKKKLTVTIQNQNGEIYKQYHDWRKKILGICVQSAMIQIQIK
jgi:hypothetical protein